MAGYKLSHTKEEVDELLNKVKNGGFDPTQYGLPILHLTGDTSAMTKENAVDLQYVYGDRTGTASVKWQGASSLSYPKKNYTIKFDNAFEAADGWGEQKKYCLKANYIDHTHARNVVSAKLWGQIVKSRSVANGTLNALPNGGAVDGFPCVVMLNGEFHGLYTFNIPKDGWMFGMGTGTKEAIVCADAHSTATQFKSLATLNGDFGLEYVSDEDNANWVLTSLNNLITAAMNATEFNLDSTVWKYIDLDSAIDYLIFVTLIAGADMTDKNYLLATYDGEKWYFSAYDIDSTYGLDWNGKRFFAPEGYTMMHDYSGLHRLMELIVKYETDRLKSRYFELRSRIMSEGNLFKEFMNFTAAIPSPVFNADVHTWVSVPSSSANTIPGLLEWYRLRVLAMDKEVESLQAVSSSLFDMGTSSGDWLNPDGSPTSDELNYRERPGSILSKDGGGGANAKYRSMTFDNNGGVYTLSAKFEAKTEGLQGKKRMLVQLLDADGKTLTTGCSAGSYLDFYKGYYIDSDTVQFTLSDNVVAFRVGFMWGIDPPTVGEYIYISKMRLIPETA